MSPFLAWGDFHARSRFARSTIPEDKWGTTRSLCRYNLLPASISAQQDSTSATSNLMPGLGTALRLLAIYKAAPPAFVGESV